MLSESPEYIQSVDATILGIVHKCNVVIVAFTYEGVKEKAKLSFDQLLGDDGSKVADRIDHISEHLSFGMKVTVKCQLGVKSQSDDDEFKSVAYESLAGLRQEVCDRKMNKDFRFGVVHATGSTKLLCPTGGVMEFQFGQDKTEQVVFTAKVVHLNGKRLGDGVNVDEVMKLNASHNFDAVPINPSENKWLCAWRATRVWTGDDEPKRSAGDECSDSLAVELRSLSREPNTVFWRSYGHVWTVINDEVAIVLGRWRLNRYESVLVHRRFFTMGRKRVPGISLRHLFKKGDRVQFVAFPSPDKFMVKWIASHVSPDRDGHLQESLNTMP